MNQFDSDNIFSRFITKLNSQTIDSSKCLARVWNGHQCNKKPSTSSEFCLPHSQSLPRGRVDNPLDPIVAKEIFTKIQNFNKQTQMKWYSRLKLWDAANAKHYSSVNEMSDDDYLLSLMKVDNYFKRHPSKITT